jgi:hypothetical protein
MSKHHPLLLLAILMASAFAPAASSQTTAAQDETTVSGTVVSSSANTMVVRTETNQYQLYVFDRDTLKPRAIPVGSKVTVISTPGSEPGVRLASSVVVAPGTTATTEKTATATTPTPAQPTEPVPVSVRRLERDIERQARRYGAGVRAGVGIDPEVLLVGVHARLGPFFHRSVSFRPNLEFGWGEVTKLFALNLEGVARLPFAPRSGRWSAYAGLGPSFVFKHQNFERAAEGDAGVDFGELDFEAGLNILAGVEYRSGLFFEMKTTVYSSPHLRLLVGYSF